MSRTSLRYPASATGRSATQSPGQTMASSTTYRGRLSTALAWLKPADSFGILAATMEASPPFRREMSSRGTLPTPSVRPLSGGRTSSVSVRDRADALFANERASSRVRRGHARRWRIGATDRAGDTGPLKLSRWSGRQRRQRRIGGHLRTVDVRIGWTGSRRDVKRNFCSAPVAVPRVQAETGH